jgi:indole-3-acetate monooxygenase
MTQAGKPLPGPAGEGGPPLVRGFALPASDWQIEDTWHVAGLKGTGSDHVSLRDKLVPATNFFDSHGEWLRSATLLRARRLCARR